MTTFRQIDQPQPGFYSVRLVKGGPMVAARIFRACPIDPQYGHHIDRSRHLLAQIDGQEPDGGALVDRVWTGGKPITQAEYEAMLAVATWDRQHMPSSPLASPRQAVSVRELPLPF